MLSYILTKPMGCCYSTIEDIIIYFEITDTHTWTTTILKKMLYFADSSVFLELGGCIFAMGQ